MSLINRDQILLLLRGDRLRFISAQRKIFDYSAVEWLR